MGASKPRSTATWPRRIPIIDSRLVKTIPGSGYTAFVLDMTSQSWRTPAEVGRPVWKHWLTIIRPDTAKGDTAFLYITGGSVNDKAPEKADPANLDTALTTNTVAVLNGVPDEPVIFSDDKKPRNDGVGRSDAVLGCCEYAAHGGAHTQNLKESTGHHASERFFPLAIVEADLPGIELALCCHQPGIALGMIPQLLEFGIGQPLAGAISAEDQVAVPSARYVWVGQHHQLL
jgi:hypothetical protein